MPELPEVETVVRFLKSEISNYKFINIKINDSKFLKNISHKSLESKLLNENIIDITRKGKYLLFWLSNEYVLLTHLRMEGKFFVYQKNDYLKNKSKHDYLIFHLKLKNNEKYLVYNDTRKFGTFHLYSKQNLFKSKELNNVAIDPLDENFNINDFFNSINSKTKTIKDALLDQKIVSGIGNIYASEILFKSKIYPFTKSNEIALEQAKVIILNAKKILTKAIENKGTTKFSFSYGHNIGNYQNMLDVYGRTNQNCHVCKTLIIKTIKGQRSTYYCPNCQKEQTL